MPSLLPSIIPYYFPTYRTISHLQRSINYSKELMNKVEKCRPWLHRSLIAAGIYNLGFAFIAFVFPVQLFQLFGMESPQPAHVWQCLVLLNSLFGLGYLLASGNPLRHWIIILIGLLAKFGAAFGFLYHYLTGCLPLSIGWLFLFGSVIWWYPFIQILLNREGQRQQLDNQLVGMFSNDDQITLDLFDTSEGITLQEMSEKWPTLVVFVRHFGCTFCRESLDDLILQRDQIELKGTRIAIVHMLDEQAGNDKLEQKGMSDIPAISDPEAILYKKFRLKRGSFLQLLGPKVLFRGISCLLNGKGIGKPDCDPYQMPGAFLIYRGKTIRTFRHETVADRPNYAQLADCSA